MGVHQRTPHAALETAGVAGIRAGSITAKHLPDSNSISCRLPLRRSAPLRMGRDPQLWRGHRTHPIPKATRLHHPAFPCSSQPRIQSPRRRCHSRKQRIRQEACCGCAGVRGSGGGPSHPMQCRELPVSINSVFQCSIPGSVRSPGRFQDSALKCSMAARGSAAAPGGTRRTIPRSRRVRDGKGWAVDGETW